MKLGFRKHLGDETLCEGENSLRVGLYVLFDVGFCLGASTKIRVKKHVG
jgi:hypothetical protein